MRPTNLVLLREHIASSEAVLTEVWRDIDDDGTGLIDYDEFSRMVRVRLGVGPKDLDEEAMRAVWLALDADSSGQ